MALCNIYTRLLQSLKLRPRVFVGDRIAFSNFGGVQRYVWKSLHEVCLKLCCTNRIRLSESTYICLSFVRRLYISENTPSMLALCVTLSSVHAQRNLDKLLIFEDHPDRDAKRGRVRRSGQTQTYGNPTDALREATVDSYGCRYESNPGLYNC